MDGLNESARTLDLGDLGAPAWSVAVQSGERRSPPDGVWFLLFSLAGAPADPGDWKPRVGRRRPCRSSFHSQRLSRPCRYPPAQNGPHLSWEFCGTPVTDEHE